MSFSSTAVRTHGPDAEGIRSTFLTVSFSESLKNLVCDSLSNFQLFSQASTKNQWPKPSVTEPCCCVSAK